MLLRLHIMKLQQEQELEFKRQALEMQAEIQAKYNQLFGGVFNGQPTNPQQPKEKK